MIAQHILACAIALIGSTGHLRVTNARIVEVVQFARERSATFRQLLAAIDTSNRVVYVEEGICRRGSVRSCVQTIGNGPYMRVIVDPRLPIIAVARQLAHEFQHVVEIAGANAIGAGSIKTLYERIGFRSSAAGPDCYESSPALAIESQVSREVATARTPSMNPSYFGSWRLEVDKSSFPTCPPSAGRRFDRDQRHGLVSAVVDYVDCVGVGHRDAFVYKTDGREYPMTPDEGRRSRTIAVSIVDDFTLAFIVKTGDVIVACGRRTLSATGKVLTVELTSIADGEEPRRTLEWWDKVD